MPSRFATGARLDRLPPPLRHPASPSAERRAVPAPITDPAELRARRRKRLPVHYRSIDLGAEITAVLGPLAEQVTALPRDPLAARGRIEDLGDACHEVVHVAVALLAEDRSTASRAASVQTLRDLAQHPSEPVVSDAAIRSGAWVELLAGYAGQLTADLTDLLGRAPAPESVELGTSASERVERALRGLDLAARAAGLWLRTAHGHQAAETPSEGNARREAERERRRAAKVLGRLGVADPVGSR